MFKTIVVRRPTAHSIKILGNDGVVGVRQRKKIEVHVSVVTSGHANGKANLCSTTARLYHAEQISDDDVGPRRKSWSICRGVARAVSTI